MNRFRAFGLNIHSDLIFPELLPLDFGEPDLEIRQVTALNSATEPISQSDWLEFELSINGVAQFLVQDGNRILYQRVENVSDDTLRLYLLGSCLGCVLQQRGLIVLHGNAVSMDGETSKIIVGHRGAGKSTAAAWHYRQGDKILADDVCAIAFDSEGVPWVIPSYPQIKLWKTSADLLGIKTEGLRRIRAEKDKFALPLGDRFSQSPMRLTEVIELSSTNRLVEPIQGIDKARCLKEHSYRYHFLEKMGLTLDYMKKITSLARQVDVQTGVRVAFDRKDL